MSKAQEYFNLVGCQTLNGTGTAFYYVDWDADKISAGTTPAFGLLDSHGTPLYDLSCSGFKPDTRLKKEYPQWFGGDGM